MFNKILIANRGEIAVRIARACRNMGIRSVAIYSKEDANSLHVQLADQRVCIGEGPAKNSYLNMDRIIIGITTRIEGGIGSFAYTPFPSGDEMKDVLVTV